MYLAFTVHQVCRFLKTGPFGRERSAAEDELEINEGWNGESVGTKALHAPQADCATAPDYSSAFVFHVPIQ